LGFPHSCVVAISWQPVLPALLSELQGHNRQQSRAADAIPFSVENHICATSLFS
jgi:hypothetical protein